MGSLSIAWTVMFGSRPEKTCWSTQRHFTEQFHEFRPSDCLYRLPFVSSCHDFEGKDETWIVQDSLATFFLVLVSWGAQIVISLFNFNIACSAVWVEVFVPWSWPSWPGYFFKTSRMPIHRTLSTTWLSPPSWWRLSVAIARSPHAIAFVLASFPELSLVSFPRLW